MKKSEYYKDIIYYIETRLSMIDAMTCAENNKDHYRQQLYLHIVEQEREKIDKWLNEEV